MLEVSSQAEPLGDGSLEGIGSLPDTSSLAPRAWCLYLTHTPMTSEPRISGSPDDRDSRTC